MNWYALYTRPRFEKKVRIELEEHGYEVFLPLRTEVKQWSDRKKTIEEPLFKGYIFIRTISERLSEACQINGISCPITFNGRPAILKNEEIDAIKTILAGPDIWNITDISFSKGEHVSIIDGPLKGLKGEWTDYRGSKRVAIRIDQLKKGIIVEVPMAYVKKDA